MPDSPASGNDPLVSIVIPMLNEEPYIDNCLESILAQDFDMSRCEILVVDGRSTDRSAEVVRSFAARDPRVRLIDNPARHQVCALNLGVRRARGRYILQMDSHCRFQSDYIRRIVETFEQTTAHHVAGMFTPRPGADTPEARAVCVVQSSRYGAGASCGWRPGPPRMIGKKEHITAGWSFRRALFDKVGLFDERLISNHDNDMACRAHEAGLGVYCNPAVVAEYFARACIRPFIRTMFRNGQYLVPMWRIRPSSFALMHVVPLVFVVTVLLSGLAGLAWRPSWLVTAAALIPYLLINLALSIMGALRHGVGMLALLPWLIPATHLAYGFGTLVGLARFGIGDLGPPPEPGPILPQAHAKES